GRTLPCSVDAGLFISWRLVMKFHLFAAPGHMLWAILLAAASLPALAAPGEDPLVLNARVEHLNMPWAPVTPSKGLDTIEGIPVAVQAKVSRYLAKSMAENTEGIQTDADVITTK